MTEGIKLIFVVVSISWFPITNFFSFINGGKGKAEKVGKHQTKE